MWRSKSYIYVLLLFGKRGAYQEQKGNTSDIWVSAALEAAVMGLQTLPRKLWNWALDFKVSTRAMDFSFSCLLFSPPSFLNFSSVILVLIFILGQ